MRKITLTIAEFAEEDGSSGKNLPSQWRAFVKKRGFYVEQVRIPPATQAVDRLVDAVAEQWNASAHDRTAWDYFGVLKHQRSQTLFNSLYRYPERDRQFLARKLLELADAIYGAVGPLV